MKHQFLQRLRQLQKQLKDKPSRKLLEAIDQELKNLITLLRDLERFGGRSNGKSTGKSDEKDRTPEI